MPEPSWSTVEYTVKSGDTLWGIARMYRTSVSAVVSENGIANPNLIYPGEVLRITLADQVSSSQVDNTYTVRSDLSRGGSAGFCLRKYGGYGKDLYCALRRYAVRNRCQVWDYGFTACSS